MKGSELDVRYQQCDGGSDDPTIPAAPGGHASDESAIFQLHGWQGWTPFFLRKKTLACFLACEVGLLLGLIALAVADENEAGIATVNNRIHYLWTFGPTAVLSVLAALWTQVEYRTKQAQPWSLLRKGPSPASKTLLLDYITTSTPEALFAALRAGHWAPVMAITSSILIKLLTVVSTGLLVLQNTDITRHDCRISTPDDFVNQFNSTKVGSAGALAALASLDQVMDPVGFTSMGVAFQSLKATDDTNSASDVEFEATVRAFRGAMDCEEATVTAHDPFCRRAACSDISVYLDVSSPSCTATNVTFGQYCGRYLEYTTCGFADLLQISCEGADQESTTSNRLMFMQGNMSQALGESPMMVSVWSNETAVSICRPTYNITDASIHADQQGNLINSSFGSGSISTPFPDWDLVEAVRVATESSGPAIGDFYYYSALESSDWANVLTLFNKYVAVAYPSANLKDSATLREAASDFFSWITGQIAKESLMESSSKHISGTCHFTEARLRVGPLSLYLMASFLAVLIILTGLLFYFVPREFASRDPGSIGGIALNLSQSQQLLAAMPADGSASLESIGKRLDGVQAQSFVRWPNQNPQFSIELSPVPMQPPQSHEQAEQPQHQHAWWHPSSQTKTYRTLVVLFLLALVIALQILLWKSDRSDGIHQVDVKNYSRFAWVYIPALVMTMAQLLSNSIAFSTLFAFTYYKLRTQAQATLEEVLGNYTALTAVHATWRSAKHRHHPVFLMSVAMLVTPLLTVVVSGMYTAETVDTRQSVSLKRLDQLNSTFQRADLDFWDFQVPSLRIGLLLTQNVSYPNWTFDELVFPSYELERDGDGPEITTGQVTARLPALRPELNCSLVAIPSGTNITTLIYEGSDSNITNIAGFTDVGCLNMGFSSPGANPFGFFSFVTSDEDDIFTMNYTAACGAYGTSETNWNAFSCSFGIYEVEADVTLDASTLAVRSATVDEATARFVSNQTLAPREQTYPNFVLSSVFGTSNFAYDPAGYYDPIFQAVIYESGYTRDLDDFPMRDYMPAVGYESITSTIRHICRHIVAQTANVAIRAPLTDTDSAGSGSSSRRRRDDVSSTGAASVPGTLVTSTVYRLRQSAISTHLMAGILVLMAGCIALSVALMDARRLLPASPGSIAGGAALLAGRPNMLRPEVLPAAAQWWDDDEARARGVWPGFAFMLGWWELDRAAPVALGAEGWSSSSSPGRRFGLDAVGAWVDERQFPSGLLSKKEDTQ